VGVGGSPKSVVRAASYGMPMILAIIGGPARRFVPFVELYRQALVQLGAPPLPVGVHSPGYVGESDQQAREDLWPHYRDMFTRIGRERGWAPTTRAHFEAEADAGSLYVGSPETVATRIADTVATLGIQRFGLKYSSGTLGHDKLMDSIARYGEVVVPRVRELLAKTSAETSSDAV
jgi:alkanesulfonate monooxygenase SsuD/methylene tetrahydromethanopterin reductase-like flavin-dependent oxidoreductase (luciferase family)